MTPPASSAVDPSGLAVLVSGGLDSAVLLAEALLTRAPVQPLYIHCGLFWEPAELDHLRRFLAAVAAPALRPLHVLEMPVRDLYPPHWSLTGEGTPGADAPDEAVFLPGRNVLLLSKAMLWCSLHGFSELALAPLESNPFPDATPDFFAAFEAVVNRAVGGRVRVVQPYLRLHKEDVIRRGRDLPLELTFSCIRPRNGRHCGVCNKCAERRRAFREAGAPDRTPYHTELPCSA
ncbi:MAG TPA: 7-cyano-7-deazaguanine synthase [Gemmataceae bacterium]|nr:7-cyano-7-deazaguanine synthase [Gemmataceae bacterium]